MSEIMYTYLRSKNILRIYEDLLKCGSKELIYNKDFVHLCNVYKIVSAPILS